MGKSFSKDSNYEEFLLSHKKVESAKDLHYGDIDIMESQDSKQIIAMKEKKFQSIEQLREFLGEVRKRRDHSHPNLIQVHEYFVISEDNFCTSFSRLIWTMEYYKKDLTVEIRQRKLLQVCFELNEIKQIAFACISGFAKLQRDGIHFSDVRAQNILLTNSLEVKLIDPTLEPNPPLLMQALQPSRLRKGTYLPPNYLRLIKTKSIPHKLTTHKSEVFSLGFVLIEACLLNEQDDCFDYLEGTINLQNYKKSIDQIHDTYGEEMSMLIKDMTSFNEKDRCDFIQLEQKYNLNSNLDKPLQSSQFLQEYSSNKIGASKSQIKLNADHSISQISHCDAYKKSTSQASLTRPLRQYDLLSKNPALKAGANTDRSYKGKESNYYFRNNFSSNLNLLQKQESLNVDHKTLPTNNSFVSNPDSVIPYIQNLDNYHTNRSEIDKSTPFSKNKSQLQKNLKSGKPDTFKNKIDIEAATPRQSISFVQQENFENQNTLNQKSKKVDQPKGNEKQGNEFKTNTKLQGQLQKFYTNMRSQNDMSLLNNSVKINSTNHRINSRSENNLLQSMRIEQIEDDKENMNSTNVEILKCLKEESNNENNIHHNNNNHNTNNNNHNNDHQNISQISEISNSNNPTASQRNGQINNSSHTPKRQIERKNKTCDFATNLATQEEIKKQNQSFLNTINEDQNEHQWKTSPQLHLSINGESEILSARGPQSATIQSTTNKENRGFNNQQFFNISEIKFEGKNGQHTESKFQNDRNRAQQPQSGHKHIQSFFNQSNVQPSFIEAQSFYLQQRSPSFMIEVIEETYEDGSVYNGEKLKGKRHGNGKFSYADGGFYEGSWYEGFMEGYGKLYYPSGKLAYEGEWKKDKFTGQGIVYNDTPEEIGENEQFDFADFDKMGECWLKYEGGFLNDQKQGQGVLYLPNGERFIGGFLNDMVEGKGIFINLQGQEIKAHFSQNKLLSLN